jgi:hypothetical protein
MADERILAAMTRFMTRETALAAYDSIFQAYAARLADVTVITGKSSEGESAQGQVVVNREDYLEWMDCLETLLQKMDAEAAGTVTGGPVHANFNQRWIET